jgi:hypothetical protein
MDKMPLYTNMCKAIRECHTIDEVDQYVKGGNIVEAIALYTMQCDDKTTRQLVAEIYLRAARRKGELQIELRSTQEQSAAAPPNISDSKQRRIRENIKIASIPEDEFEVEVKKPGASKRKLLKHARDKKKKEINYNKPYDDMAAGKPNPLERYISELDNGLIQCASAFRKIRKITDNIGGLQDNERTSFIDIRLERIAKNLRELGEFFNTTDTRNILKVAKG